MAPKKQTKPNGFVLFAMDLQNKQGTKYRSLKEACDGAAPLWSKMSADKRRPYDNRARQMKGAQSTNYTSEGLEVDKILKQEKDKIDADEKAKSDIQDILTVSYGKDDLINEEFFIIHFNIFCYCTTLNRYYPAEISVVKFDLKNGVLQENIFHSMIESGPLPPGYKFEAKSHSEATHMLPIPFDNTAPDNQEDIYFKLKEFLQNKSQSGGSQLPILYADKKYADMTRQILNTWSEEYDDLEGVFRVYNFQYLFHTMRNIISKVQECIPLSLTERELETDIYSYIHEIACKFHKATSKPQFCTQSFVTRNVYILCEACCGKLNIELLPDQHIPLPSSDLKGFSSQTTKRKCKPALTSDTGNVVAKETSKYDRNRFFLRDSDSDTVASGGSSTASLDKDFPSLNLGTSKSQSRSGETNDWNSLGMPAAKLPDNGSQYTYKPRGRGFSKKGSKTIVLSSSGPVQQSSSSSNNDVVAKKIGRGRGFIPSKSTEVLRPGI